MSDTPFFRAGDIFRICCGDSRYCYGIVMADIRTLTKKGRLPPSHHLHHFPEESFFYRLYQVVTEDPGLTPECLAAYPLGPAVICHGKLTSEDYTRIAHRPVTVDDLQFPILAHEICYVPGHSQAAFMEALPPDDPYWGSLFGIFIEWGAAQTNLENNHIPPAVRTLVERECLPGYYHTFGIDPKFACPGDLYQKGSLTLPREREAVQALLPCFGLAANAGFDDFAVKFRGLPLAEIINLLNA